MKPLISKDLFDYALNYRQYIALTEKLLSEGRTTGSDQSHSLYEYTKLNVQRMSRIEKTLIINKELQTEVKSIDTKLQWLVITEPWCGDAANSVPVISEIAKFNDKIDLKLVLRDSHPLVMDLYLTEGTRSIPILVCFEKDTLMELWKWGPRPASIQKKIMDYKASPEFSSEEFKKNIQLWYFEDKYQAIQNEILELIKNSK